MNRRVGCGGPTPVAERPARGDRDEGSVTVWALGLCVGVLFLGGLGLDLARAFLERRDLAGLVDGAAVAASSAVAADSYRGDGPVALDPVAAWTAACAYLTDHADPFPGCEGISVAPEQVEVTARRDVPLTLLRILAPGEGSLEVEVTARAAPRRSG